MHILFSHTFLHSVTTFNIYNQPLIFRMAIQESTRTVYWNSISSSPPLSSIFRNNASKGQTSSNISTPVIALSIHLKRLTQKEKKNLTPNRKLHDQVSSRNTNVPSIIIESSLNTSKPIPLPLASFDTTHFSPTPRLQTRNTVHQASPVATRITDAPP